jgi:hypothetical protein
VFEYQLFVDSEEGHTLLSVQTITIVEMSDNLGHMRPGGASDCRGSILPKDQGKIPSD